MHLQPNRYKDGKPIIKTIRKLFAEGKLDPIQARVLVPTRPVEELYDLENDPYEISNLADSAQHQHILKNMGAILTKHMLDTNDMGLIPEPELEVLAKDVQSRFDILRQKENTETLKQIFSLAELRRKNVTDTGDLVAALQDKRPSVRWWAARLIGNMGSEAKAAEAVLIEALKDGSAGVRVEAARALCKMDLDDKGLPVLLTELKNADQVVRHYASLAFEDIGEKARPALDALKLARNDKYGYVKRLTNRVVRLLQDEAQK
jgi:uncharacterized sulfatase